SNGARATRLSRRFRVEVSLHVWQRGSVNIVAKYWLVVGSALLTVISSDSAPPPPPPPGGRLLFQEDFENSNLGARGWYDNTSATISTTEHQSGTASAQYHWLKGATSPTSGDAQRHKFTASNSVYISYYVKYSTNWVGSGQSH